MDSVPQSPNPNLTRTGSPATSTPERTGSPMKGLAFSKAVTPALAETSTISAKGENGLWDDDESGPSTSTIAREKNSRARRELSVIDESSSIAQKDEADSVTASSETGEEIASEVAPVRGVETEDELDEGEDDELPDVSEEGGGDVPEESPQGTMEQLQSDKPSVAA
jgi:hypothetical protein